MVRVCEIKSCFALCFNVFVLMKFSPVISGNGFKRMRKTIDEFHGSFIQRCGGSIVEFTDEGKAGFAFHQCHNAIGSFLPHDGIDLPMALITTGFDGVWSLGDMPFIRKPATAVVGAVAFTALFLCATQVFPQIAAIFQVPPYIKVNGFM